MPAMTLAKAGGEMTGLCGTTPRLADPPDWRQVILATVDREVVAIYDSDEKTLDISDAMPIQSSNFATSKADLGDNESTKRWIATV